MDFGEPLYIGYSIPARHDEAKREAIIAFERLAIQRICQQRLRLQRMFERDAAGKLLVELVSLLAKNNFLIAAIVAEEDDLAGVGAHADFFQQPVQRHAREPAARRKPFESTRAVAGTFV